MKIEIENYNLEQISIQVIKKLIEDKPFLTMKQYAQELGLTERTLYRYNKKYNLIATKSKTIKSLNYEPTRNQVIRSLVEMGYRVEKL